MLRIQLLFSSIALCSSICRLSLNRYNRVTVFDGSLGTTLRGTIQMISLHNGINTMYKLWTQLIKCLAFVYIEPLNGEPEKEI